MEKEKFFTSHHTLNWQSSELQTLTDQLPPCFLNLNWDQAMEQSVHFESALSSIVSSPSSNPPPPAESVVIHELIGRLGSICNSGEISPQSHFNSTNTTCYNTPLNSPPKLNLSMMDYHQNRGSLPISGNLVPTTHLAPFSADPGFAERAARFSCFGGSNYTALPGQFGLPETGRLSRASSSKSLKASGSQMGVSEIPIQDRTQLEMDMRLAKPSGSDDVEFRNSREEPSVSDPIIVEPCLRGPGESNARKRKAVSKGKGKDTPLSPTAKDPPKMGEVEDLNAKRCRSAEATGIEKSAIMPKEEQSGGVSTSEDGGQKQSKENNAKAPEPPKQDYIHVRARRGQATDSHSLAERVRREKISERMKFLQNLVPCCNKVTGKAVMLDEIINYVQSLQRQVEFLSMKLATVNPRLDINVENFLTKDMHQEHGPLPNPVYPLESSATAFSYAHQSQQRTPLQSVVMNGLETQCSASPLESNLYRTLSMQLPSLDGYGDAALQLGNFWEDDLQSVVQMGFGQNQENSFSSQSFHAHMKIEL